MTTSVSKFTSTCSTGEEGYEDDIRFAISEAPDPSGIRMLAADEISFLLTPDQAEQMAALSGAQLGKVEAFP
jgi:hypothetical protein